MGITPALWIASTHKYPPARWTASLIGRGAMRKPEAYCTCESATTRVRAVTAAITSWGSIRPSGRGGTVRNSTPKRRRSSHG